MQALQPIVLTLLVLLLGMWICISKAKAYGGMKPIHSGHRRRAGMDRDRDLCRRL